MSIAMQDASAHSPASVATASLNVDHADALKKLRGPPIMTSTSKSFGRASSCVVESSSPGCSASSFVNNPNATRDDIDAHRRILDGSGHMGRLFVSEATRRSLEGMDEDQVQSAHEGFERVKLRRLSSGIAPKDLGRLTRKGSFENAGAEDLGGSGRVSLSDSGRISLGSSGGINRRGSLTGSGRINGGGSKGRRRHSQSMGALALGKQLESFGDVTDESSGEEEGDDKDERLREVEANADETLARIVKRNSMKDVAEDADGEGQEKEVDWAPASVRRRSRHRQSRRAGVASSTSKMWKPLSSTQCDFQFQHDEAYEDAEKSEENETGGIGGFWNKLTASFTGEAVAPPPPSTSKSPKRLTTAAYFRKGKKKADNCQFLNAVALFNLALVRQREELGEDHVDCGTTLNEIGVCWMMLGERYPALTAFEEALYIRQNCFGVGAREVAETTNNIWMILHEERLEMESLMEEEDKGKDD